MVPMRSRRLPALVASGVLTLTGLGVVTVAPPAVSDIIPTDPVAACTTGGPRPCIVSFTVNGAAPPSGVDYIAQTYEIGGSEEVSFNAQKDSTFDLGSASLTDTYSVTIDMGTLVPRVTSGKAQDVVVSRSRTSGGYQITVTGRPVTVSGQCDQSNDPWVCPEDAVVIDDAANFNNVEWDGYFDFQITDYGSWDDVAQRNAMYGMNYFTNVAATSIPPDINYDSAADAYFLQIAMANRRFREDDTTLVQGRSELRIPNAFLRLAYGVPNPELMTGSSLTVTGGGTAATTSVTQEAGDDAMVVLLDGLTFPDVHVADHTYRGHLRAGQSSMKVVRVKRGVLTPGKPGITVAKRLAPGKARVTFTQAKARGARVTGSEAVCIGRGSTVSERGSSPSIVVTGLKAGRAYDCKVRALSKAGPGRYSASKHLAARP